MKKIFVDDSEAMFPRYYMDSDTLLCHTPVADEHDDTPNF